MNGLVHELEAIFLILLACVILFAFLAEKIRIPYPIVLVLAGLLISFIPGLPPIKLDPDVIFLLVLPPLLYHASWITSWREFRANLLGIAMLAFAVVGFTVAGVSLLAPSVLHGFDWRLGFVLGAVVAPTDAIAAVSIANQVGLPRRIVDLLEGESLLNDATGLLALEFGVSMVVYGETPTLVSGVGRLLWLTIGGIGVGLIIGFLVDRLERRLENSHLEITLSILVPYSTYLLAEAAHASGVLAVVSCGLWVSWRSAEFYSPSVRLRNSAVWDSFSFILNGLTFILIGLQLPAIRAGIREESSSELLWDGFVFAAMLIALRLLWVFPGAYIIYFLRRRFGKKQAPIPSGRETFILGWTGMRGVISLAAAISIPALTASGQPFPQRPAILALTFSVILITLVLQGLSLPWIIGFLGLAGSGHSDEEEKRARLELLHAALEYLHKEREKHPDLSDVYDNIIFRYSGRLDAIGEHKSPTSAYFEIQAEATRIERQLAIELRNSGEINDEILRKLELELDLTDTRADILNSG